MRRGACGGEAESGAANCAPQHEHLVTRVCIVSWNLDNVGMNEALMTDYKIDQFAFVIYIGILILFNFVYWVTFAPLMHV